MLDIRNAPVLLTRGECPISEKDTKAGVSLNFLVFSCDHMRTNSQLGKIIYSLSFDYYFFNFCLVMV